MNCNQFFKSCHIKCVANQDFLTKLLLATTVAVGFILTLGIIAAWAGPPFVTDDPEPVEYQHWEVYVASQYDKDRDGKSGTAPHFEINYGVLPDTQLHMIAPFSYSKPKDSSTQYGFGDMEVGVKYRFIKETKSSPQVGVFPIAELPTGDSTKGLGERRIRLLLPVWLQKSWDEWTTYGGGGFWRNPGPDNKNYWQFGWEVQRELSKTVTLGAEFFHFTAKATEEHSRTGFKVGGLVNLTEEHHILFSVGRDIHGPNLLSMYIAYQWTFGPKEEKK